MLVLRRGERLHSRMLTACSKYLSTQPLPAESPATAEYTTEPQYPEIQDLSFQARKQRESTGWHATVQGAMTAEEKQIKINMPRYWGYKVVQLGDGKFPYNCLPATQHYTRTIFEELKPTTEAAGATVTSPQIEAFVQAVKGEVQEALEYAHDFYKNKYPDTMLLDAMERERVLSQLIVEQINRIMINALMADCQYLQDVEVDYNPRHEAFWFVGGINPPKNVVKSKKGREWQKEMANEPVDRLMQYVGAPYLAVRHRHQLPSWQSELEADNTELAKSLPHYEYDPRTLGYVTEHRHGANIPGFWPGSLSSFGCISYQSRAHMQIRPSSYGADDFKQVLHAQAVQASYAWLLAQANYNGFNTFSDLTYPMNTQTIITNGRDWSFYEYQLNTLLVHSKHVYENARVNFCRGTGELQLYQGFDEHGKCVGLNEQVLRQLVQLYANAPTVQRDSAELTPFLHTEYKRIADYPDVEQRTFLERTFKHLMANRTRHLAQPEIYMWEKLYKIDNKTRQMEPKRRFFELGINPWKRTLDQHQKEYIPRAVRPEGPKSHKKWKQMYYP